MTPTAHRGARVLHVKGRAAVRIRARWAGLFLFRVVLDSALTFAAKKLDEGPSRAAFPLLRCWSEQYIPMAVHDDPGGGCLAHRAILDPGCLACAHVAALNVAASPQMMAERKAETERLLIELMYVARRVAEHQVVIERDVFHCYACGAFAERSARGVEWHRRGCEAGTTLLILARLQMLESLNANQRRENAPEGDDAGGGTRPRVGDGLR